MYLRNFFMEYNPHSATGYIAIDKNLYRKLDRIHRTADKKNHLNGKDQFSFGSLTLIPKGYENNYELRRGLNYIIIYAPLSFRQVDADSFLMYCGNRKNGRYLKLVKIPIEVQFVLYLALQNAAQQVGLKRHVS